MLNEIVRAAWLHNTVLAVQDANMQPDQLVCVSAEGKQ